MDTQQLLKAYRILLHATAFKVGTNCWIPEALMNKIPHPDDGNQTKVLPACLYREESRAHLESAIRARHHQYYAETRRTHPEAVIFGREGDQVRDVDLAGLLQFPLWRGCCRQGMYEGGSYTWSWRSSMEPSAAPSRCGTLICRRQLPPISAITRHVFGICQ